MAQRLASLTSISLDRALARLVEDAATAIGRLDARITASPVAAAWRLRAAWTGYAHALQLQGHEIDEIDVFAFGCGIQVPGRAHLTTVYDPFEQFEPWRRQLVDRPAQHWREGIGAAVDPDPNYAGPRLIRALEALRQISLGDPSIEAWLALPVLLARMGITQTPLPCLVSGEKRLRFAQAADPALLRRLLRALAEHATTGLARLDALEHDRNLAVKSIAASARQASLTRLAAQLQFKPVTSPQGLSSEFGITIAGAGKLLSRAEAAGLVKEVRGTQAWKLYLTPDLAVSFSLAPPARGRPRGNPPPLSSDTKLAASLDAFDREMAQLIDRYPDLAIATEIEADK